MATREELIILLYRAHDALVRLQGGELEFGLAREIRDAVTIGRTSDAHTRQVEVNRRANAALDAAAELCRYPGSV